MCLTDKEKCVITSTRTLEPTQRYAYKHRLRKRLKKMQDDVTFLHNNTEQLLSIGIKLEDYPMLDCTYKIKMPDKLYMPYLIQRPHSNTETKPVSKTEQSSTPKSRWYQNNGGW